MVNGQLQASNVTKSLFQPPKYPVVSYNPNAVALSRTNYFNVPKLYEYIKPVTVKPDFYVGPNGAVAHCQQRHIDICEHLILKR